MRQRQTNPHTRFSFLAVYLGPLLLFVRLAAVVAAAASAAAAAVAGPAFVAAAVVAAAWRRA